jgi:exonuclease VII small subunit
MLGMLQVVIGLVFVLLLLSLLATTIMELIASFFSLRGKNLEKALENILACTKKDDEFLKAFKDNPLYKQLSYNYGKSRENPSYLSDESFTSILFDLILDGKGMAALTQQINDLPDDDLKKVLKQFLEEAENDIDKFRNKVKSWYNNIMDRASGWYKRYTQKILIGVGFMIAILFNADTIAIYERLESDPETLQSVLTLAEDYVNGSEEGATTIAVNPSPDFEASLSKLEDLVNQQIESVKSPLGLGWKNVEWNEISPLEAFTKALGWVVTALAISLGAPFWFDLLRKLVNIRSSGNKPKESA